MLARGRCLTKERELCCGLFLVPFTDRRAIVVFAGCGKHSVRLNPAAILRMALTHKQLEGCSTWPDFSPTQPWRAFPRQGRSKRPFTAFT